MKKITPSGLLLTLSFLIFYLCIIQEISAQDCKIQAANKASTLARGVDDVASPTGKMNAAEMAKMKPHLAKAENWVKKMLTNFTGAKLLYYNNFFPDYLNNGTTFESFYKASGIKSYYSSKMMFFAYYCYDNSNTIHTEAESGSNIQVTFNNVFASGPTTDAGVYIVNGKPVFKVIQKKRSEGRIDFYEQRSQHNATAKMYTANDFIILRNSDKPLFVLVTRKEYLQQMLTNIDAFGTNETKGLSELYKQNVKQFEEEMKVYKAMDKTYTPEKEAKRRKWFEEDQEKLKKTISKTTPDAGDAREVILQYLKKPAEWLSRGFNDFYPYSSYTANSVKEYLEKLDKTSLSEESQYEIVAINPAYFNSKQSADVPQLITVRVQNGTYAHMEKVNALIKQPNAFAALEAMLNPGNPALPVVAPAEITSSYSISYLAKLKTLSPLIIPPGMKPSITTGVNNNNNIAPTASNFTVPAFSAKLNQLSQLLNTESYTAYIQQLHTAISNAVKPNEKKKADEYLKNKTLTQSKDISNSAFVTWLQNKPAISLYLYSKAVTTNTSDALAANNFSAFLLMGGLPEKAIPILEYWNKQKPGQSTLLCNLGNAYYRLGDVDKSMKYLQNCIQYDTLNTTANKILCILYAKKGDTKKATDHGTRSLSTSYDEQVIAMLRQLNSKSRPGEIMSRLQAKEFPMLKRVKLPSVPSALEDMERFEMELNAEKRSIQITIDNIESKIAGSGNDLQQKLSAAGFTKGMALRVKAQAIIMDGMQTYQSEKVQEADVFNYQWKKLVDPYNAKTKAITTKYAALLKNLQGGEAGDEDKIQALELAKCKEINAEKEKYLAGLSPLVNGYAQRQEFISRKFYRDYANWSPYWVPDKAVPFPSIEKDYLKDIAGILSEYKTITRSNCTVFEPPTNKEGSLQKWEDEYCANFKGKIGVGPAKITWTCNSWGIEGGEGIVGEFEMNFSDDGAFEEFTIGAGFGETWSIGEGKIVKGEASASMKEFFKIGPDKTTGQWGVKDFGFKTEVAAEFQIGNVSAEVKVLELSVAVNAGIMLGGAAPSVLHLNQ